MRLITKIKITSIKTWAKIAVSSACLYLLVQCQSHESKVEYFNNGRVKSIVSTLNGLKDGEGTVYNTDGKITAIHHYKNDSLTGTSSYYNEDGSLSIVANYRNSIKQGHYEIFYTNGNIAEIGNYHQGIKSGKVFKYYEDDSAKLHNELYVVGIGREEYPYYNKIFKRNGELEADVRQIQVKIEPDSIRISDYLRIYFRLSEKLKFDSASVVVGLFDKSFKALGPSDTLHFGRNHETRTAIHLKRKGEQLIRGKWSAIKTEQDADSTYQYDTFGFFEERVVAF